MRRSWEFLPLTSHPPLIQDSYHEGGKRMRVYVTGAVVTVMTARDAVRSNNLSVDKVWLRAIGYRRSTSAVPIGSEASLPSKVA
jgi:hypothetical protein